MTLRGRYLGSSNEAVKNGEWDTAYAHPMRNNKTVAKVCGYDPKNHSSLKTFYTYIIIHATLFCTLISFSYLLWGNFIAHTCWCMLLFMFATYNGAVRYVFMMTKAY